MACNYAYDREGYGDKFSDAGIIGHITPHEAKIWIRVKKPGKHTLIVFNEFNKFSPSDIGDKEIHDYLSDNSIISAVQITHDFKYDTDLTHVFSLSEMESHTTYYYAVVAAPDVNVSRRWRIGYEKPRYFKTTAEDMDNITFGVSSCHDPYKKSVVVGAGLWDEYYELLDEKNADFIIACGDQVYVDATEDNLWLWINENKQCLYDEYLNDFNGLKEFCVALYRRVYRKYWHSPGLQKVFGRFPSYMMWDDHEIMDGWGSYTTKERLQQLDYYFDDWGEDIDQYEPAESDSFKTLLIEAMWYAAKKVYIEYQHSHNPQPTIDDGLQFDYSFKQGNIGFYVLDMRGNHDYENPEGERLLGVKQFERFKSWIESEETKKMDALFIVSPVPVIHWESSYVNSLDILSAKDDFRDEWDHESNYKERDKMLDLVFSYSAKLKKPIVFLSGDVHCAAIFELTRNNARGAKVFQFTSSGITRPPAPSLVEFMIVPKGHLGVSDSVMNNEITYFKKHAFITRYNFGLLECTKDSNGKISIYGNIYSGDRKSELHGLSRKRVKFS